MLRSTFFICSLLYAGSALAVVGGDNEERLKSSFANIERNKSEKGYYAVDVLGRKYIAHKEVFSPKYFKSTEMLNQNFPFKKDESFLEIGSGVGVSSIIAAKEYNNKVVSVDINHQAVILTAVNAANNDVESRVDARQSDLFSSVGDDEKFDTIYWDLPYVYSDAQTTQDISILQRSVSDPGYEHINIFLKEARSHLNTNGRIIIGFGSNGDYERFEKLAGSYNYSLEKIYEGFNPYREGIKYQLIQLVG